MDLDGLGRLLHPLQPPPGALANALQNILARMQAPRARELGRAAGGEDWDLWVLALAATRIDGGAGGQSDGNVASGDGECARRHPFAVI